MAKAALSRFYSQNLQLAVTVSCAGWLVLCALSLLAEPVAAQACQAEKLRSKTAQVEQELQPRFGPIRLHRLEELEDDVFLPRLGSTNIESPFAVYQIEQRRFFVNAGEIQQNVPARTLSNYVAISQDGEQVYRLAGFPESEASFKRLVADYHLLPPQDRQDAQARALYCARVVFGTEPKQWVVEERQVRLLAVSHFVHQGDKDPFGEADHWLRSFRSKNPKADLNMSTASIGDGAYLTRLPLFWAPLETRTTPEIRELQIRVDRDGFCHRVGDARSVEQPASTGHQPE